MFSIPEISNAITDTMAKVVQGKEHVIRKILLCLFSEGHLLIQDLPGIGKTLISKALAKSIDAEFSRIQFTPDLLPGDIVGISVWKPSENIFEFHNGPIFANLVLADEINRTSPKTQSALLEAMAENQVTVATTTRQLPRPFMVMATQNPTESYGTYPLLESQLDRFLMVLDVGYPDHISEINMLTVHQAGNPLENMKSVVDIDSILTAIKSTAEIYVDNSIRNYLIEIANATRHHPNLAIGISPRATLDLQRVAQTNAAFEGRDFVIPEDIQSLLTSVLAHRVYISNTSPQSAFEILQEISATIPVPAVSKTPR